MPSTKVIITDEIVRRRVQNAGRFLFRLLTPLFATLSVIFVFNLGAPEELRRWRGTCVTATFLLLTNLILVVVAVITKLILRFALFDVIKTVGPFAGFQLLEELRRHVIITLLFPRGW